MTTIDPDELEDELQERLRAAVEKTIKARQARQARRDAQAYFRERRTHGLKARHQAKLDRNRRP